MSHKITRREEMEKVKKGFAFHMYPDSLIEWCMDYDARVEGIKLCTPKDELELRLRLFKLIPPEKIPACLAEAFKAYDRALNKKTNWNAYKIVKKIEDAYYEALEDCMPELLRLHEELCPDCPWNGWTIFSSEYKEGK